MFLIGKAHPDLQDSEQTGQRGPWLSEEEKRETIDAFYAENQRVPLSLNHKNVGRFGYVPRDDVIGEVLDLYNNSDGELMVRAALSQKHDAYGEINESVFRDKVRWGFSVGLAQLPDEGHTHKLLTHMALTPDPGFAAYDTHLFNYHTSEDLLNARIASDLYAPGQGKTYGTPAFDAKLKRSQESPVVRLMSQPSATTTQQQQQPPVADDAMDVQQPQQQQQAPPEMPVQLSFHLNTELNDLSAINEEIARGTEHLRAVGKRGVTVYDMDEKFQGDMAKLREMSKEKQKKSDDHYALLKEQSGVDPARLKGWGNMLNSTDPAQQPARTAVHDLVCANAQLMEKVTTDLKRKHDEEKQALQAQLDDLITKKQRYAPVYEQRREPPLQLGGYTQKSGVSTVSGNAAPQQYSLLNAINREVISSQPLQNAAFKQTFLNPKVMALERVPDYSATQDQVLIAAQLSAKVQQIDSRRY